MQCSGKFWTHMRSCLQASQKDRFEKTPLSTPLRHPDVSFCFSSADTNECTAGTHNCSENALCTNEAGSFSCQCNDGFAGDGNDCNGNTLLPQKLKAWLWQSFVSINQLPRATQNSVCLRLIFILCSFHTFQT